MKYLCEYRAPNSWPAYYYVVDVADDVAHAVEQFDDAMAGLHVSLEQLYELKPVPFK